jgi:hypothetical protein
MVMNTDARSDMENASVEPISLIENAATTGECADNL